MRKFLNKFALMGALLVGVTVQADTADKPAPKPTPAEVKAKIEATGKQITADNRHVLHLQAIARKEKDVIKLTCINDKLILIKAQMNVFDSAQAQLEGADTSDGLIASAVEDVDKSGAEVKKLRGEAQQCAGELDMYKQESAADVEIPELDDPTQTGGNFDNESMEPEVEVPGFASPFK